MKHRSGYTLIEALTVISILGATLVPVTATIHVLYQTDHRLQDGLVRDSSVERLGEQLRMDAHQATDARVDAGMPTASLQLTTSNQQTIRYSVVGDGVERTVFQGDERKHTELYRLRGTATLDWKLEQSDESNLIVLDLAVQSKRPDAQSSYHVEAALRVLP